MARLVSYKDVNGSGIRVPTIGLSVTGPMTDAVRAIPSIRFEMDDLALIIGFCDKRERGVEILPEGAEKLGLCLPRTSPDMDLDAPLSSGSCRCGNGVAWSFSRHGFRQPMMILRTLYRFYAILHLTAFVILILFFICPSLIHNVISTLHVVKLSQCISGCICAFCLYLSFFDSFSCLMLLGL